MFQIKKTTGKMVTAYRLGDDNSAVAALIAAGKIKQTGDDTYEIFSQEAVNGKGEVAHKGDYVKVDSTGAPYPNAAAFFERNHRHIVGDQYEQIPQPLAAWDVNEPMSEEVQFLIAHKGLVINEDDESRYFNAELWGTMLSAAKDAVICFYSVTRDDNGVITDADFNFIAREEFGKTYEVC